MVRTPTWTEAGRAVAAVTRAGPDVSVTSAAATVSRLRRAVDWSNPLLARLSGLDEAARRAAARPTVIVDRRGSVAVCAQLLEHFGGPVGPLSMPGAVAGLRSIGAHARGLWDPVGRRRVLVAPNVLSTAVRRDLDQSDYARWVALSTGLWGVAFEQAPWLSPHLAHLSGRLPAGAAQLARALLVVGEVVNLQMGTLTPQDLASARWIRANVSDSLLTSALAALRRIDAVVGDIESARLRARALAREVLQADALEVLLASVDHLPTAEEFDHPSAWLDRVGR